MIGLAFSLGFCTGAGLGSFVVLVVCLLAMRDRRVTREPARMIAPTLRQLHAWRKERR